MRKIPAVLFLVLMFTGLARAGDRPVFAHTDGKGLWVSVRMPLPPATTAPELADTRVFDRPSGVGQPWQTLGTIGGGIRDLSSDQGEVVAALNDGSWTKMWDGGSATGAPIPADGRVLALCESAEEKETTLWVVALVPGGIEAANEALAADSGVTTLPTTVATTTQATTKPATTAAVLFQQVDGRWMPRAEVPDSAVRQWADAPAAIWAGHDRAAVALADSQNTVCLWSWDARTGWKRVFFNKPGALMSAPAFGIFTGVSPAFWLSTGPGQIAVMPDLSHPEARTMLNWTDAAASKSEPAAVCDTDGSYRVYTFTEGHKVIEHDFKADGQALAGGGELALPLNDSAMSSQTWIEAMMLAVLTFTTGAVGYRHLARMREPDAAAATPPVPAPLGRRMMAGLFDLSPVLLVVIVISGLRSAVNWTAGDWFAIGGAFAFYWMWVGLFEVLTGRSLGKTLLGLHVVTIAGNPVTQTQLVVRNLLRPIDPLLLIVVSPLGQRTADVIADTMVVSDEEETGSDGPDGPVSDE
jgi:uncharacterized RDD family membrane protein YckC